MPQRRTVDVSAEIIALFVEIEAMWPQRDRAFTDRSHELARRLGLVDEWWTGNSVNDHSAAPCHPPDCGYIANDDWFRCREVRNALLAAVSQMKDGT